MSNQEWQSIYRSLVSGKILSQDFEPYFLFELASKAVVSGDFEAKKTIYEQFIFPHPKATQDDKTKVLVYRYDRDRRSGNYRQALDSLSSLTAPSDVFGKAEYLQAIGQCQLILEGPQIALETQRQIIALSGFPELPTDKQLYYLETIIAMKLAGKQADEELDEYLSTYEQLLKIPLEGVFRKRAVASFYSVQARAYELKQDFRTAAKFHFTALKKAPDNRSKTGSALEYLFCIWKFNSKENSPGTQTLVKFFKSHENLLQPTDIHQLQEKYDFVKAKMQEISKKTTNQ